MSEGPPASQEPLSSSSSEPASYYGQPVIKPPVWKQLISLYLFTGGLAGASAPLAAAAELSGNHTLAKRAWLGALIGAGVSPVLLIWDLGRPARFLNMLRVVKVSSPMSMGVWILSGAGTAIGFATLRSWLGLFPRLGRGAAATAAVLGPPLSTYTAVLFADTAVPAWHEARDELPWLFASSATASAGAFATATTPLEASAPARRLAVGGAVAELVAGEVMERRLGRLISEPYRSGRSGRLTRLSRALNVAGAGLVAAAGVERLGDRRRSCAAAGGALIMLAAVCTRAGVFEAGKASARDPKYTVIPQRQRLEEGRGLRQHEQVER